MTEISTQTPLFQGLSSVELSKILGETPHSIRTYDIGDPVALQGTVCNRLMVVLDGIVEAQMVSETGKQIVIERLQAGNLLAPAFIYARDNRFPVSIVAAAKCSILNIQKDTFSLLMQREVRILTNFLMLISERSNFLSKKVSFFAFKSIRGKLADFLLSQPVVKGVIHLNESQQSIADRFGIARPSLARALGELADEGLIKVSHRSIEILNPEGLRKISET
ncbi:MAG: Crp/Fnr family transcriptional regulator [Bacteroidales bacterium]|jgi:CRP/FNR family transcriptional regulator, dissimilatory nitrate respiration regulator|nr:Crp/Fnr family transcriptional regulator [Bacteroidales bacterium]